MKKERKCSKKKKIILGGILGVILTVVLVMVIAVAVIANQNVKAMNHCVSAVLEELEKDHTVTQLDPGAYEELTMYGLMKFRVEQYRVEGLGNLY